MAQRHVPTPELIDVARRMFLEHGAHVPTQAIADAAGISQAALFKRFGTKQALLRQAMVPPPEQMIPAELREGPVPDRPIEDQLVELTVAMMRTLAHLLPNIAVLKASGMCPNALFSDHSVAPPLLVHGLLTQWLSRADALGLLSVDEPDAAALVMMGGIQLRMMLGHFFGPQTPLPDAHDFARGIVTLLHHGLSVDGRALAEGAARRSAAAAATGNGTAHIASSAAGATTRPGDPRPVTMSRSAGAFVGLGDAVMIASEAVPRAEDVDRRGDGQARVMPGSGTHGVVK